MDKKLVQLYEENGVQSVTFSHSPNAKDTSWGHNICGPDIQKLMNSTVGKAFIAAFGKMSDNLTGNFTMELILKWF